MTISEARLNLSDLSKKLSKRSTRAVAITKKGKPILAVMNWESFESLVETLEILSDPEQLKAFHKGVEELNAGKGIPWEEAKKELA